MSQYHITSPDHKSSVIIDQGELISYIKNGEELIHQKGDPGWRNSDTEMFPVLGPTESNEFKVKTPRGEAIQDQHGLLRELSYEKESTTENTVIFHKSYDKNTIVQNSKFPEKSTEEFLSWPYSFLFSKKFRVTDNTLIIEFDIKAEEGMPFMLGYHPAFKLSGNNTERIKLLDQVLDLQEILNVGSIAYPALGLTELTLLKQTGYHIKLSTEGFNNFMLWTEVPGMICLEPISAYPYTGESSLGKELFMTSSGTHSFRVVIEPFN